MTFFHYLFKCFCSIKALYSCRIIFRSYNPEVVVCYFRTICAKSTTYKFFFPTFVMRKKNISISSFTVLYGYTCTSRYN